ncbi:Molybdenum-pterin-binding protein MopA [Methylophilaceae bacterium]|nr:Molybdenum-pterin-binding protein MopA [Methylophilaceae bacterium]
MHKLKIRIDMDKTTAMGPGKADLLELIIETGSISAAAKRMHMSYRRAWELVDVMNHCFDEPLVITNVGGKSGGGAEVTAFGLSMLQSYRQLIRKTSELAASEISSITRHLRKETH